MSSTARIVACPGCGLRLPDVAGSAHAYMTSSAACWNRYGALLAVQYADPERMRFHQLVVDAHAAQHPGGDDRRAVQSVGIHLMTLALFLEHGVDPARGPALHREMVERPTFHRLVLAEDAGSARLTHVHVPLDGAALDARARAVEWAADVWQMWSAHHETVRTWLRTAELLPRTGR